MLTWEPEHGYRELGGEWVLSPSEAVGGYVEGDSTVREDYETLARRVQAFWLGQHLGEPAARSRRPASKTDFQGGSSPT